MRRGGGADARQVPRTVQTIVAGLGQLSAGPRSYLSWAAPSETNRDPRTEEVPGAYTTLR